MLCSAATKKMRTIRRTIFSLGLAILIVGSTLGQGIDQERMDRDLKIAENILGTLSNDRNLFSGRNIESNYVPDYGVIFSMPQSSIVFATGKAESVSVVSSGSGYSYVVADSPSSDDKEREAAKNASSEDQAKAYEEKVKEQMTLFLVDYVDLIGQLKPTDRIMVNLKNSRNQIWISGERVSEKNMGMTAEILKGDLIAYKSGKASREQTIGKIKFTEVNNKVEKDLELFSSILS